MKVSLKLIWFGVVSESQWLHLSSMWDDSINVINLLVKLLVAVMFCHCYCELFAYSPATEVVPSYFSLIIIWFTNRLMDVIVLVIIERLETVNDHNS